VKPGVYENVPFTDYLKFSKCSYSALAQLDRSPLHLRHALTTDPDPTPAMELGSAIHAALLEPAKFEAQYLLLREKIDRRTKEGKAAWEAAQAEARGRTILRDDDVATVEGIRAHMKASAMAQVLLGAEGPVESSFLWKDPNTGLLVRARPDKIVRLKRAGVEEDWIVDLKSCADAAPDAVAGDIVRRRYYLQAALYTRIISDVLGRPHRFAFLFWEKQPPYALSVVQLSEGWMEAANSAVDRLLALYHQCVERDQWPDYGTKIQTVSAPRWWSAKEDEA